MKDRPTRDLRDLCAQPTDDDGTDPRLDRKDLSRNKANRKDLSLCKQVMRSLDLELAGWPWAIDAGLWIVGVEPAPDATRLRVHVAWTDTAFGRIEVLTRLESRAPALRTAVAAAITRKRAPRLEFEAAPPPSLPIDGPLAEEAQR